MLLVHLKQTAKKRLETPVLDFIIEISSYLTNQPYLDVDLRIEATIAGA